MMESPRFVYPDHIHPAPSFFISPPTLSLLMECDPRHKFMRRAAAPASGCCAGDSHDAGLVFRESGIYIFLVAGRGCSYRSSGIELTFIHDLFTRADVKKVPVVMYLVD